MELTQVSAKGGAYIETYGAEGFRISGHLWTGSILVLSHGVTPWSVGSVSDLTINCFDEVFSVVPPIEIFLLGYGSERSMVISGDLCDAVRSQGLALEAMSTGAACRTYNLLVAENRRVAAGLMPVILPGH